MRNYQKTDGVVANGRQTYHVCCSDHGLTSMNSRDMRLNNSSSAVFVAKDDGATEIMENFNSPRKTLVNSRSSTSKELSSKEGEELSDNNNSEEEIIMKPSVRLVYLD